MGEWVVVFLHNLVESSEVDAKMKGAILLVDEENQSSMREGRGMDETHH